ncbi:cytochrome-c peroxidase [Gluconobacter wancherniae]|uniref:cytochrome-c peroxidase n=1 Tax=Gluconobacter wancherniae TaxID=1307955 RepID=UPI0020116DA6|nr:cytochrome c peroxidase [Gluconobacter wancherniae]
MKRVFGLLSTLCLASLLALPVSGSAQSCDPDKNGRNPCPTQLVRPPDSGLSAMGRIGRELFHDPLLSGSGRLSCASCHDPAAHYGPSASTIFALGGLDLRHSGRRTVPTLTYLERTPPFSIGPDNAVSEAAPSVAPPTGMTHTQKSANNTAGSAAAIVPQGGLFWDARADTLQEQATGPLYDLNEMASTPEIVAKRLRTGPAAKALLQIAGPAAEKSDTLLVAEAMFALARYQMEDSAFHPYSSRYDKWLEGKSAFSPQESRGYRLFNDPAKGNCAACHVDTVGPDRLPPLFTDHQYEALGVPANLQHAGKSHPDLGLCESGRVETQGQKAYCGFFSTPTLRNASTRGHFFHNGVYSTLRQVIDFYVLRDTQPERIYPLGKDGQPQKYNDLPKEYHANVDIMDAPFDRHAGDRPALSVSEREDIIAFLKTLEDAPYSSR